MLKLSIIYKYISKYSKTYLKYIRRLKLIFKRLINHSNVQIQKLNILFLYS